MKHWLNISLGLVVALAILVPLQHSFAAVEADPNGCYSTKDTAGKDEFLKDLPNNYTFEQPLGARAKVANVGEYINIVYRYALGIVGVLATVLMMVGGLIWLSSAGNEQMITQGKEIITSALIGLVIALFSYSILYWINPQFTVLNMDVFKIPIPKEEYNCEVPKLKDFIRSVWVENGSEQACQSVVSEINWIAEEQMRFKCPECTLHITSAYRTGEEQAPLYECYQKAKNEGYYSTDGKTKIKDGCPEGCSSGCNIADKPCCSDHNRGKAIDVCLTAGAGVEFNGVPVKSSSCNDKDIAKTADGGGDPSLKANQDLLRNIMESGQFKRDSKEWWHFTIKGDCSHIYHTNDKGCMADSKGFDNSYYCEDVKNHQFAQTKCINSVASCAYLGGDYILADEVCIGDYQFSSNPTTITPVCNEVQPWVDNGSG